MAQRVGRCGFRRCGDSWRFDPRRSGVSSPAVRALLWMLVLTPFLADASGGTVEGTVTVNMPRQVIPVDNYWVMGDNRGNSADSRVFGPINRKLIVGRAFLRVFPVTKVGRL